MYGSEALGGLMVAPISVVATVVVQELEEQLPSLRRGECLQVQAEELRLF